MPELSVLIPARNEEWLNRTVADVLQHARADTEIIVVLDGQWPKDPLPDHPKVQLVYKPVSIGQRAATNLAARISTAKYVMKLDAHCALDDGFDVTLITAAQELGRDVTQIPAMVSLHVFDWKCPACGHRHYQDKTPQICPCSQGDEGKRTCACRATGPFERIVVWRPRVNEGNKRTEFWRFDHTLHFQYWGAFKDRPEAQGEIVDVMSSIGACFFMRRDRFWKLGGLDEKHGSWGQYGVEIACKSWLSGGRHVVNKRTWFAHLFRTAGGDLSFPYPLRDSAVNHARQYSRDLWMNNAWPGQTRPLSWLIDKFAPLPDWHDPIGQEALQRVHLAGATFTGKLAATFHAAATRASRTLGIVYYSDCRPDPFVLDAVRENLLSISNGQRIPIVSVTLAPVSLGFNRVLPLERGILTMFRQILTGLELLDTEYACLCEHDVLYPPEYFTFVPPTRDRYYYNLNCWKVDVATGRAVTYVTKQTSQLCADRQLLVAHYRRRVSIVEQHGFSRAMGYEPGSHRRDERVDDVPSDVWHCAIPTIDLRHGHNLTDSRWSRDQFRSQKSCEGWQEADDVPGWGRMTDGGIQRVLQRLVRREQRIVA